MNIDINLIHGTGLDGRITREDLLKYAEGKGLQEPGKINQKPIIPEPTKPVV